MKKLIPCLLTILILLLFVAIIPVTSTELICKDPVVVLVDGFTTYDLVEFMKATYHLKDGDTLKVISIGGGGEAITCMAMINHFEELKTRGVNIITEIQGMACSANAFIWLAGSERVVHRHDLVMFHLGSVRDAYGNKVDIEDLEPDRQMIVRHINRYLRFKLTSIIRDTEIVNNMLQKDIDSWYTGLQLFEAGVATKMVEN